MLKQRGPQEPVPAGLWTLGALLQRLQQGREDRAEVTLTEVVADEGGLTPSGRLLMVLLAGREARPRYDAASRELRWRGRLVKRLERAGSNQLPVLLEFERQGWPARIDDPLPPDRGTDAKVRLRETVNSLNDRHKYHGIRFMVIDGGVGWEAVDGGSDLLNPW